MFRSKNNGWRLPLVVSCMVFFAATAALAYTPNPDTAVNRQDQVYSTKKLPKNRMQTKGEVLTTGKDPVTGDEVTISAPPDPSSRTYLYQGPGYQSPAIPYAYPDVNLDGQEFFPEKADPTDPVFTYRPSEDQTGFTQPTPGQPQLYTPGTAAPNVYQPGSGLLQVHPGTSE